MSEGVAPCPFCKDGGNPFPYLDRQTKMGYAVKCHDCQAQGPIVLFETDHKHTWDEVAEPAKAQAKILWNIWWERLQDVAAMPVVDPRRN